MKRKKRKKEEKKTRPDANKLFKYSRNTSITTQYMDSSRKKRDMDRLIVQRIPSSEK